MKEKDFLNALYSLDYVGAFNPELIALISNNINGSRYTGVSELATDLQAKLSAGLLTPEEANTIINKNKVFDDLDDFDIIYSLFIEKFNIDLLNNDINYFVYKFHLEQLFLEKNALTKRIELRSFTPRHGKGMEEINKNGREMREKYDISGGE